MKAAINHLEAAEKFYQALPSVSDRLPPMLDILELFSGSSKFTIMANRFGLNALQPIDIDHGPEQDLKNPHVR